MNIVRRLRLPGLTRMAGLLDQAFYSIATLAQTYVYAKLLAPEAFGEFALVQGTCLLVQGFQRSVTVLPMIMTAHADGGDGTWPRWDLRMRALTFAVLLLLAVFGGHVGIGTHFRTAFALSAVCSLGTLAYEFQRRWLLLQRRSRAVLVVASTYLACTLVAVAVTAIWARTVEAAALGLLVSSGIGALVGWRLRGPAPAATVKVRDHAGIVVWNLLSYLPFSIYGNAMVLIVGALADVRAVALFSASRLFMAPVQTLYQAIDGTDKPRARAMFVTDGHAGLMRSLRQTRATLLKLGLPYLLVVAVGAQLFVPLLFGNHYAGMVDAARVWALVGLLMLLNGPLETGLLVLHKSNLFFWTRSLAAVATVGALVGLRTAAPATAPMWALVVGWGSGGLFAWMLLWAQVRRQPATADAPSDADAEEIAADDARLSPAATAAP